MENKATIKITKSLEEYIKAMYVLKSKNGEIRVTDVANKLKVSKASVNKAVKALSEENLLTYETYGNIELTKEGEKLAKKILEAYDIAVLFFRDVLGMTEECAISDAEKLKTAISDEALNALARYVHKELGLQDLNCNYDINNEKCHTCIRRKINKEMR